MRALLLIADIGGYTKFMTLHRLNLAHAQSTISQLLEAVIDGAGKLKLAKLEGDAAFFWQPLGDTEKSKASDAIVNMRTSFLKARARLIGERMCSCESCMQIGNLTMKFVLHEGDVVKQKVKSNEELAGVDVILVHRLLKNEVPIKEYALGTDTTLSALTPLGYAQAIDHDLEGIGPTRTHWVDLNEMQLPAVEPPSMSGPIKWWRKLMWEARSLPYVLGFKEPCKGFANAPSTTTGAAQLES